MHQTELPVAFRVLLIAVLPANKFPIRRHDHGPTIQRNLLSHHFPNDGPLCVTVSSEICQRQLQVAGMHLSQVIVCLGNVLSIGRITRRVKFLMYVTIKRRRISIIIISRISILSCPSAYLSVRPFVVPSCFEAFLRKSFEYSHLQLVSQSTQKYIRPENQTIQMFTIIKQSAYTANGYISKWPNV